MISLIAVGACRYWNHDNTQNVWITKTNYEVSQEQKVQGLSIENLHRVKTIQRGSVETAKLRPV